MTCFMAATSDSHSVKSSSPQDASMDLTGRLAQMSPASSPTPTSITPLTRSQLQQALLYLIQVQTRHFWTRLLSVCLPVSFSACLINGISM